MYPWALKRLMIAHNKWVTSPENYFRKFCFFNAFILIKYVFILKMGRSLFEIW